MSEIRSVNVLQDNLLLSYDISNSDGELREMDYLYVSRFLRSLLDEELSSLWLSPSSTDFISDLNLTLHLSRWILPILEEMEWYEDCVGISDTIGNCLIFLHDHPEL